MCRNALPRAVEQLERERIFDGCLAKNRHGTHVRRGRQARTAQAAPEVPPATLIPSITHGEFRAEPPAFG